MEECVRSEDGNRYYRIALVSAMECGDRTWACFEALRMAGHAVEVIDPRRFPEVLNEGGGIVYDRLAAFSKRFKPDYIGTGKEGAEAILDGLRRAGAKGGDCPARRFVVFGFVGPGNFGDELIFSLICRELERRYPGAHIECIGHNPPETLRRHGVVSVTCDCKADVDIMLRGASALVYMAGIMFDDPFDSWSAGPVDPFLNAGSEIGGQVAFTLMASQYDVPCVYLGIGAGPLENPDARRLIRLAGRIGARYLPRDAETERLLLAAGVRRESVERKADLAFLLVPPSDAGIHACLEAHGLVRGGYVAVSLREHRTVPDGFERRVASALRDLCMQTGLVVALVDASPTDWDIHERVRAALGDACGCVHLACADTAQTVKVLAGAHSVLAMRLHCSIVANCCGVLSAGLNYNEKVEAYYELMGRADALIPMEAEPDRMFTVLCGLERNRTHRLEELRNGVVRCHALASEAFDRLVELVEVAPAPLEELEPRRAYSRNVSPEAVALGAAQQEIERLRRELECRQQELQRVKASWAWRAGYAITFLPRRVRQALRRS